jgi:hypothetical protein
VVTISAENDAAMAADAENKMATSKNRRLMFRIVFIFDPFRLCCGAGRRKISGPDYGYTTE